MKPLFISFIIILIITTLTGCVIGVLLFYKESDKQNVYRSSKSKKDYYTITAYSLNHCGCTNLFIKNYKDGKEDFLIKYFDNVARKHIYQYDPATRTKDTIKLEATESNNFTTAFDTMDKEIFSRIDTLILYPPKGSYRLMKHNYKGYIASNY